MYTGPPPQIQRIWQLYNYLEELLIQLWETYEHDFLTYYFPEISCCLEPPRDDGEEVFDDIPF